MNHTFFYRVLNLFITTFHIACVIIGCGATIYEGVKLLDVPTISYCFFSNSPPSTQVSSTSVNSTVVVHWVSLFRRVSASIPAPYFSCLVIWFVVSQITQKSAVLFGPINWSTSRSTCMSALKHIWINKYENDKITLVPKVRSYISVVMNYATSNSHPIINLAINTAWTVLRTLSPVLGH